MDDTRLRASGLSPVVIGPAVLDGYALVIESRATLAAEIGSRSYGVVMALSNEEAQLLETESLRECWCYNLPETRPPTPPNESYRAELSQLLTQFGFPAEYVREVSGSSPAA
ncbi:MAG: hypothetical protein ACYTA3_09435 [Planctomycetota bacterium]|jgi:hypothetical protein